MVVREICIKRDKGVYVHKVASMANHHFIANGRPNVAGMILAGQPDFQTDLSQSYMLDPRLKSKIINLVDISYGGKIGFKHAIELAAESLQNGRYIEKELIVRFFNEISHETGKFCFGVENTLKALQLESVENLICWENVDIQRYVLKTTSSTTEPPIVLYLTPEQEEDESHFRDNEVRQAVIC